MDLKNTFVFDTRGTTVPMEVISGLRKALFEHGERYTSKKDLEELKLLAQNDVHSPEFREYTKRSGPFMRQVLKDGLYVVSFYPDVRPALEAVQAKGDYSRILSKGEQELIALMYAQAGLDSLIRGVNSSSDLSIADKTDPGCYLALEQEVMKNSGEAFIAYTSDDPKETNACREAFPSSRVDVFYIDRGQGGKEKLSEGIRLIKNLKEVL